MIDFRYHLVSIVAIFLALTVGIVLGSTVLQEPLIKSAQETTAQLRHSNDGLRLEKDALAKREAGYDSFVTAAAPGLVRGMLAGERVVIVEAPGADADLRDSLQEMLTAAGATITGRVSLTDKYLAPEQSGLVDQLATTVKSPDVVFPDSASTYDKAGAVLARAVVTGDVVLSGKKDTVASGVLGAFVDAGLVTVEGDPGQRAALAVVIPSLSVYEGTTAEVETGAVVSLAAALDAAGRGTVLAGTSTAAGPGGVITALRDSGDAAASVSTVDTADVPPGRAVVVYALREQLAGQAGQYGLGAGAAAFLPTASPTLTPSAASGG